ncbi:hypothetical protein ACFLIM_20630 [Nonomuraea sp. M3C6]|uniref:Phytanoyl-CoA dioxygenase (PhyH) n=1 Tax=Nonomuraea marmarensis TaxID=3351344 RepID=A0ABW7AE35_9ACTN
MTTIFSNSGVDDETRRGLIYRGDVFVHSPTGASLELVAFAKELIADAFGRRDPETAQFDMAVEDFAALLAELKPRFIHHPRSKALLVQVMEELGFPPEQTYFDVPRLRTSTSNHYLNSGISYAYHAHRDCWYAAPFNQINWWLPIFEVVPENVFALHPRYFDQPLRNGSGAYEYGEWQRVSRPAAAQHIYSDTRQQPRPEEDFDPDPELRIVTEPGGMMIFSGAHLHSTVNNTSGRTRFSIDFRCVNIEDVRARRGAPNVDAACLGTTLRDFMRCTDQEPMPEELAREYEAEAEALAKAG